MELPDFFKITSEQLARGYRLEELKKIYERVSCQYREEKRDGSRLVASEKEATVYAIARMPATYCAVYNALFSVKELLKDLSIKTILDFGAGTGAASFAALSLFDGIDKILCVEREPAMIQVGQAFFQNSQIGADVKWLRNGLNEIGEKQRHDLVIASYSLNELSENSRKEAIQRLWDLTEKILLIVEPGTPQMFMMQQNFRESLLRQGANPIAPCPHVRKCPLPPEDWCHFICRVPRTKIHRLVKGGESPFEDEKFTYGAYYRKEGEFRCQNRIIRHPKISKNAVTVKYCNRGGEILSNCFHRGEEGYKRIKKLNHGDIFD